MARNLISKHQHNRRVKDQHGLEHLNFKDALKASSDCVRPAIIAHVGNSCRSASHPISKHQRSSRVGSVRDDFANLELKDAIKS